MQKTLLFSLMLLILGGSTRAEDTAVRDLAIVLTISSTGPLAYCAYKAACGSKPAKTLLKVAAYVFCLSGMVGTSVFAVVDPNFPPLKTSCCVAAACLFGIGSCVSGENFANDLKSYATATEEVEDTSVAFKPTPLD